MAAALLTPTAGRAQTAVTFDTDMYCDIDDMLALAMLHALDSRGEVKLLAVTIGTEGRWIAPYVDLVDTFYGHGDIPVGTVRGGITVHRFDGEPRPCTPNGVNYTQYISQLTRPDGAPVYPRRLLDGEKAEEAVHLLRRVLAAQPDGSVVMVEVGYVTNLARLLESKPDQASKLEGRALIKAKVRFLSLMGGSFADVEYKGVKYPAGFPEFNLRLDVPSAQKLFSDWPTPIVLSGTEIGFRMRFRQSIVDDRFKYVDHHPIADTYNYVAPYYRKVSEAPDQPHDHSTFDLTSVLYASRPSAGYFTLSNPGKITVLANGGVRFEEVEGGTHRYLVMSDVQRARALEAMEMLASEPPARGPAAQIPNSAAASN
jgi:inosine-uridine nucleoside N-ribohydrolase